VAPLAPRPGHGLLRCPICGLELTAEAGALTCRNRHSVDIAHEGYVNLLRSVRRRPAARGDGPEQLRHRASFLERGHFDALEATIAEHVQEAGTTLPDGHWRAIDAGCGTGHHLARFAAALDAPVIGLGLDIASEAARRAARRWPAFAFAVADLWAEWPVHDGAADLVIKIFAPKNFTETARVLRPGGWIAVVYPGPNHLVELSQRFALMRQHGHKTRRYSDAIRRHIGPLISVRFCQQSELDSAAVRDAVLMGPNAHHISPSAFDAETGPFTATFDLVVPLARKSARSALTNH
jgi:23S rRNA (guanine745-N1)-methyltransferase